MNISAQCSSSNEGECKPKKVIKLESRIINRETKVITDDGEKSVSDFLEAERMDAVTQDAGEVRKAYLEDLNRQRRHQKRIFGTSERKPLVDRKASYDDSSYVRHLTVEDLKLEQLEEVRKKYWSEYGAMVDENIIMLVQDYEKVIKSKVANPLRKTQFLECALLGLTKGPTNFPGLIKRLDTALEMSEEKIKFRFKDNEPTFKEKFRQIIKADPNKRWLRKYLVAENNGSLITSTFEFPPPMMQIAAQFPDKMRKAWMLKLPKGDLPYSEDQLIEELPILKEMVDFTDIGHHATKKSYEKKDKHFRTRRHANEGNRRARYKEVKDYWVHVDDMKKAELVLGIMQASDCIIGTTNVWIKEVSKFMHDHKKAGVFNPPTTGEMSTIKNKMLNDKSPFSKLVVVENKTQKVLEFGLIPDAAAISWRDVRIMWKGGKPGWSMLDEWCEKNQAIDMHIHPEKYIVDESDLASVPDETPDSTPDSVKVESLNTDEFLDGLEVIDETGSDSPLDIIMNAVMDNVTEEQLGKIIRQAMPGLIELFGNVFKSIKTINF